MRIVSPDNNLRCRNTVIIMISIMIVIIMMMIIAGEGAGEWIQTLTPCSSFP